MTHPLRSRTGRLLALLALLAVVASLAAAPATLAARTTFSAPLARTPSASMPLWRPAATVAPATSALGCSGAWTPVLHRDISHYSPAYNYFEAIFALSDKAVWAVGGYPGNDRTQPLVEFWDGSRWNKIATPTSTDYDSTLVDVAAVSRNDVWAVGYTVDDDDRWRQLVLHWDGRSWTRVVIPGLTARYSRIFAVDAASATDVWLAADDDTGGIVLHWDGAQWTKHVLFEGSGEISVVEVVAPDDIWALGWSNNGMTASETFHWDGNTWNSVVMPVRGVSAVSAVASDDIWGLVGAFAQTSFAHWDGQAWTAVATPDIGFGYGLEDVFALASDDVWAVGNTSGASISLHWDGESWSVVDFGKEGERITSVHGTSGGSVWRAGFSTHRTMFLAERYSPRLEASVLPALEPSGAATITLQLSSPVATSLSISYTTGLGTATEGVDYAPISGTLQLEACASSASLTLPVMDDATWEGVETIPLLLEGAMGIVAPISPALQIALSDSEDAALRTLLPAVDNGPAGPGMLVYTLHHPSKDAEIYKMNPDGSGVTALTSNGVADAMPSWSPDQERIVFVSAREGQSDLWHMSADGDDVVRLTNTPHQEFDPVWSPDGASIAFGARLDNKTYIYVVDANGRNLRQLSPVLPDWYPDPFDSHPAWSPDSKQIAYTSRLGNWRSTDLLVINANGSGLRQVVSTGGNDEERPAWSPDGETIAYATGNFPYFELMLVSPDGSRKRSANAHFTTWNGPTWSPDGRRLAYTDGGDIFVMGLDHSEPRQITPDTNNGMLAENDVRWSLP